jgi:CHAT domain-containing protein
MSASAADGDVMAIAERLKAEAEHQLNVDGGRSLEIADRIYGLGSDDGVRGLGLMARGDALRVLGRRADAMHAYQSAAELFRSAGDEVGWARTRIGAIATARYTGEHAQILADADKARRILADHGLWLRLARLENNGGALLSALGRPEEALAAHERALAAAERLEPRNDLVEAEVFGNLSLAYYQVEDYERAEEFLARAVAIFERDGQHEHVARAHRNFARYAAGRGHYSKALAAVFTGRRALLSMGRPGAAAYLGQVGVDCLVRLNRPGEATELADSVLAEFESAGAPIETAATHGLRAVALARLGDRDAALAELDRAEQLFGNARWEAGPANVRLGRAVVLGESGHWQEALVEAEAVSDELRRRGALAGSVQADLVRARALRALGQVELAAEAARSAVDLVRDRSLPWLSYHGWRLLGELARDAGEADAALAAFLEAIGQLEHVQGRILTEYRASFLADKSDVYEPAVDLLLEKGDLQRAFELADRAKSRALVDALAGGLDIRVRPKTAQHLPLVAELTNLRREHDMLITQAEASPRLAELERGIGQLLEELRLAGADDLERLSLLEAQVYSPQSQLDSGTALVEFYVIGADVVAFVMDRDRLRAQRIPSGMPGLTRLQRDLQLNLNAAAAAPDRRSALEPNARALLRRLYDAVLGPIATWLADYERLVIVPHGPLHRIPFAALHDGRGYLIERFEVVLAPSASSLTFCLRPRGRSGSHTLVVGNSAGGVLPGVVDEARAIAALCGGDCLIEGEATVAELRRRARDADVIHLAAHGVSRLDAPLFSYLRLADSNLTALDCFELELDCALVTLSACESGRGQVTAGDEQMGLPRAFLYAGARAVVHSLWRIDDRATQTLMQRMYAELKSGRGRGAALRTAQLNSLGQGVHPFLWAALTLVGDWR